MGIIFAILSPAIYSINNYIDKFFLEKINISPVVMTIYSGIIALLTSLLILVFTGFYPTDIKTMLIILTSGFLTDIYMLPYFKALNSDETSRVVPLFQFIPVFVLVLGFLLLGEKLSIRQYFGSATIIFASFLLSLEKLDTKMFKLRPALWYMISASLIYSLAIILFKFGVKEIPFWHSLPYEGFGISLGALAIYFYKNNKKIFWKETREIPNKFFGIMAINEGIFILARYTGYFAVSLTTASLVAVLGGFQPLFVLIYGIILSLWFPKVLKEVISKKVIGQKLFSILLIFTGLYLIFL